MIGINNACKCNVYYFLVAVDSVTPTIFVISESGKLVRWFDCAGQLTTSGIRMRIVYLDSLQFVK